MMRLLLAALLLLAAPVARAEFPERPLRIIVGFAAGGTSDISARLMAEMASAALGQPALVENRTGANGMISAEAVARSAPDGYTLWQCPMGPMSISPGMPGPRPAVDVTTELVPVATVALSPYGLAVAANGRFQTIQEFLAAARAGGRPLTYGSAGNGTGQHLSGARLARALGVEMVHVPYRGAAPAVVDLLGGRIDFIITNLGDMTAMLRDGQLRALALGDRLGHPGYSAPKLPDLVPGLEIVGWYALCGPRGMPTAAINAWERAIRAGVANPAFRQRILDNGLLPLFEDAPTLATRIERDRVMWRELIQAANIRAE